MMRFSKILIVSATLALGACSHYSDDLSSLDGAMKSNTAMAYNASATSPQDIQPAAGGGAATGGSINNFLARDYYNLARFENDKAYDYKAAKNYTKKAMMAQKGEFTAPSKISSYDIPSDRVADLQQARANLVSALKESNTPENGATLAKAQSSFDCWLERAEEADDDAHFAECKGQFEQSMALLIMPAAGDATATTAYQISFMQTSAIPDEASQKRIEYIAQYLQAPENAPLKLALSASGDEVGNARIAAVQKSIVEKGVSADRIVVAAPAVVASGAQAVDSGVQATIIGSTQVQTTTTTSTFVPTAPVQVAPAQAAPTPAPVPAPVQ